MKQTINPRKAAVIGCGFVGSATAFTLMQSRLFSELVLLDVNHDKADGEAKDIAHGIPFAGQMKIYAGTYDDIADSAIIIVTAGANQKPNETRLDLVHKNVAIDSRSVHSFIIGEHGDSEIAAWSSTNVSGIPLNTFCEMRGHFDHDHAMDRIAEDVKNSAYDIISKKQATYYGIAMSVKRICECIIRNERSILPVSSMMHGEYGIDGISLSMPAIVGLTGIETHVPIALNAEEAEKLRASAETLKKIAATLEL